MISSPMQEFKGTEQNFKVWELDDTMNADQKRN